jgi:hypothetical protein
MSVPGRCDDDFMAVELDMKVHERITIKRRRPTPTPLLSRRLELELEPNAVGAPITAALVLAPSVLIVGPPLPIVRVDADPSLWGIGVFFFSAPAIACFIANDGG